MRKATNRTSYDEVIALYEATGRNDFRLQTISDIKVIHNFDVQETTGYEDLTDEYKEIFETYVIEHMNNVGMEIRITMFPRSVHYVREITSLSAEYWDEEDQRNYRKVLGKEYLIVKPDGKTKKWKRFLNEYEDEDKIDSKITKEFLRVDWKQGKRNEWYHVSKELEYY